MSDSFNFSGKISVITTLKTFFKNEAHESLQFLRIFAGRSLSVPDFVGYKNQISLITSFNSIS